jgi:hypothetical protein
VVFEEAVTPRAMLLQTARKARRQAAMGGHDLPPLKLLERLWLRQLARVQGAKEMPPGAPEDPWGEVPAEWLEDEGLLGYLHERLQEASERRKRGAHYTGEAVVRGAVRKALEPLVARRRGEEILGLRILDPAMGAGVFLVEACEQLGALLSVQAGVPPVEARRKVAERCLWGLDLDEATVQVARWSLWLKVRDPALDPGFCSDHLRVGDALAACTLPLPEGGFDACLGNPPWVSYAGRAAQPLTEELRAHYTQQFASFRGYRNLQGLFVERCARELKPGGRLGLVLPSSMAELAGYAPVRVEHDRWCEADPGLEELDAGAFEGVFQPSMVLLSTRRSAAIEAQDRPWPLRREDLDQEARGLLEHLARPPLPAHLFGERGLQTGREHHRSLRSAPDEEHRIPVRCGADIRSFYTGKASFHAREAFGGRPGRDWGQVRVLIRQTARYPIASRADGQAFRNSLLAGFEDERYPADFLLAYLNSTPIRWLHYQRHRDARQGMPQVKVSHLRGLPAPPAERVGELARLGGALADRNAGIQEAEQAVLDGEVGRAFGLRSGALERMRRDLAAIGGERAGRKSG